MGLEVSDLKKVYERDNQFHHALKGVSFSAPQGAFVTLLGPSGCGKSTLLNMIAGLDEPTEGSINIGTKEVYNSQKKINMSSGNRDISMVFQSYAIWPHMTVKENVEFPLKHGRKKFSDKKARDEAILSALRKVHLINFKDRPAPLLSGGQQQRVSLARAVAQSPTLILLDEPLSNLDANLRDVMQKEIRSIVTEEGVTALYVTHDQKEALSMSDIIIVMSEGNIEQVGTPYEVYYHPKTRFVADFMGAPNVIEAKVKELKEKSFITESVLGSLEVQTKEEVAVGEKVSLVIRKESFSFDKEDFLNENNLISLRKSKKVFLGEFTELICSVVNSSGYKLSLFVDPRKNFEEVFSAFYCPSKIHYIRG